MNFKKIATAAMGGLIAAVAVDYHAFKQNPDFKFDFTLAFKRWVMGAVAGAIAGVGSELGVPIPLA
jgi:hypothetical protein